MLTDEDEVRLFHFCVSMALLLFIVRCKAISFTNSCVSLPIATYACVAPVRQTEVNVPPNPLLSKTPYPSTLKHREAMHTHMQISL